MDLRTALVSADHPRARAAALQGFIDCAAGAVVEVPPGTWVITTIFLRSGTTLRLARGAVLKCHPEVADYPDLGHGGDGNKDRQPFHLVVARDAVDVGITGEGTIDGNGFAFWDEPMIVLAKRGVDVEAYCDEHRLAPVYRNPVHPWWRERKRRVSPLVQFERCIRVRLDGILIKDSPGWTVHLDACDDVRISDVTLRNHLFGPNTDGFDINGCRDVVVSGCDLTCGDDAIILKSTADSRACERIVVTGCILASNCAALGLGAETAHAIRDVVFAGNVIRQALRGVQIEMWEAGTIENVTITGLTGSSTADVPLQRAISLNIQHHTRSDGALGKMRGIRISDCTLTSRGRIIATAADGAAIEDLSLQGIRLNFPAVEDPAVSVLRQKSFQMANSSPEARVARGALVADNCHRLVVRDVVTVWPAAGAGAAANTELNPYHADAPHHAAWLRRSDGLIDAPYLTAFDPAGSGIARIAEQASRVVVLR